MEKIGSYFLDTYAIIEIIRENINFERFKDTLNFTSLMNLLETHYIISKNFGEKKADAIIDKLKKIVVEIKVEDIKEASRFRLKNSKHKFSCIDCLGYSIAFNKKIKFLTGDKEFKGMENVEFVK